MVKVLPYASTGWCVELSPGKQPILFPTRSQAIVFALAWAETSDLPCEVGVYDRTRGLERLMKFPNGSQRRPAHLERRRTQIDIPFRDRRHQERRAHV